MTPNDHASPATLFSMLRVPWRQNGCVFQEPAFWKGFSRSSRLDRDATDKVGQIRVSELKLERRDVESGKRKTREETRCAVLYFCQFVEDLCVDGKGTFIII